MRVWVQAVAGAAVMALALGIGSVAAELTDVRVLGAALCTLVVLLLLRPLRRRKDLGLVDAGRGFLTGVLVTGGSAALVLGIGTVAGWLEWSRFDGGKVAAFLLTNAVIAVLLEAFPEEVSLRGHTWTALRSRYRGAIAAIGTTALFLLVAGGSSLVNAGLGKVVGIDAPAPGIAPPGEDPVSYLILLTIFGLTLITARTSTGSLWAGIGTHLTFLTVNRLSVAGSNRDAGWSAETASPDALLLVPLYLLLTASIYQWVIRPRFTRRTP